MFLARTIAILFTCALTACGGNSRLASECPEPSSVSPDYVIGPGDSLQIFVWRNPEVSATVQVRPDGRISTPLVEDMVAAGKTPSVLARDMEAVLGQYLRSPTVNVIMAAPGQSNLIQVLGQVNLPQGVPYRADVRILEVVQQVGGLQEFAAGNRAKLARQVNGAPVECSVRLDDLMSGDLSQNVRLFPGDIIIVPESRF